MADPESQRGEFTGDNINLILILEDLMIILEIHMIYQEFTYKTRIFLKSPRFWMSYRGWIPMACWTKSSIKLNLISNNMGPIIKII